MMPSAVFLNNNSLRQHLEFLVQDEFYNAIDTRLVSCTMHILAVGVATQPAVHQACASDVNGTSLLAAFYTATAGVYAASAHVGQPGKVVTQLLLGEINVTAAEPSAAKTRIPSLDAHDTQLTAGVTPQPFAVDAVDAFGNAASADCTGYTVWFPSCNWTIWTLSTSAETRCGRIYDLCTTRLRQRSYLQVLLLGPGTNASMPVTALPGGNCSLAFQADSPVLQTPGQWQLQTYLGDDEILDSPLTLTVLPAPVDPAASYAVNSAGQQLQPCSSPPDCQDFFQVSQFTTSGSMPIDLARDRSLMLRYDMSRLTISSGEFAAA